MKRPFDFLPESTRLLGVALLAAWAVTPALAQYDRHEGLVDDWSSRHVIFSNPGTLQDAMMNGRREEWERIVNHPRYHMQQMRRGLQIAGQIAASTVGLPRAPEVEPIDPNLSNERAKRRRPPFRSNPLHADWSVPLSATANRGVALGMGPAKYSLSIAGTPSCSDYVVFPVNAAGTSTQANLVGLSNLYTSTCAIDVPTVLFAYNIGSGTVQTSPVLSLDGTKVAFVETIQNGSRFHVLTLDQRGTSGCPNVSPCNGTDYNHPATPGTLNNAVDTTITLKPLPNQGTTGVTITRSSPFIDYTNDTAYVGDDTGQLHKITGVFKGTPTEAGSPWPVLVNQFQVDGSPVFDSNSQHIFVISLANLYCVTAAGAFCSPTASITLTDGGSTFSIPVVDSTTGKVFVSGEKGGRTILTQATTALDTVISVDMGFGDAQLPLYRGAFDHAYFTSVGSGHMYFCGDLDGVATPTLYRVGFNSSGTINTTKDPSPAAFQLVTSSNVGSSVACTPLIEVFNASQNLDYLFLGVKSHGAPAGCVDSTCIMSFILPASGAFPTAPNATLRTTTTTGNNGTSDMIIDNVSGAAGASQIYFGNLQDQTGVQASQSALQ
jgi:hypothetical protein